MATTHHCDRQKTHVITSTDEVYSVSAVTIRNNKTGEIVFSHDGWSELCEKSRSIVERHLRVAFQMTKDVDAEDDDDEPVEAPAPRKRLSTTRSKVEDAIGASSK